MARYKHNANNPHEKGHYIMSSENINAAGLTPMRSNIINVRFSAAEKAAIVEAANKQHLRISTFIRQAAMKTAERTSTETVQPS